MFFDITYGNDPLGRVVIGMYGDVAPKTTANFVALGERTCTLPGGRFLGASVTPAPQRRRRQSISIP